MGELEGHEERFDHIDDAVETIMKELNLLRLQQARELERFHLISQAHRGGGGPCAEESRGNIEWTHSLLQGNGRWESLDGISKRNFADLLLGKANELALELLPAETQVPAQESSRKNN